MVSSFPGRQNRAHAVRLRLAPAIMFHPWTYRQTTPGEYNGKVSRELACYGRSNIRAVRSELMFQAIHSLSMQLGDPGFGITHNLADFFHG